MIQLVVLSETSRSLYTGFRQNILEDRRFQNGDTNTSLQHHSNNYQVALNYIISLGPLQIVKEVKVIGHHQVFSHMNRRSIHPGCLRWKHISHVSTRNPRLLSSQLDNFSLR
jgi:hypothetical protein